jgi:hypothetical protein
MASTFAANCPADLKFMQPFLQKADEMVQANHPVLSYYCKFYAVSLALRASPSKFKRTQEIDAFLARLFDLLEEVCRNFRYWRYFNYFFICH